MSEQQSWEIAALRAEVAELKAERKARGKYVRYEAPVEASPITVVPKRTPAPLDLGKLVRLAGDAVKSAWFPS